TERAGDVCERLAGERDRTGADATHRADERHVFNGARETFQPAAILFERAYARPIKLAVHERAHQTLMPQARRERELALRYVERRLALAQRAVVQTRRVLERSV